MPTSIFARIKPNAQVYCVSMFPLLIAGDISWAKPAVATGAIIQVCASYIEAPLKSVAFVGAAASAFVIINPVSSYFLCCAAYGIFYASFLNRVCVQHLQCKSLLTPRQVEFPEKVLKAEFVGELLFLPVASLCLIYFKSLELLIILVGAIWWLLSPDWIPEKPDPSKGSNTLFLAGWMCCSAVMSALLLSGVFIVRPAVRWCGVGLIHFCVGFRGIRQDSTGTGNLHWALAHHGWRVQRRCCL
jgi:hypothetical protein